ncbi:hypothetical protein [Culicoidibacter larvae]|uniref:Uncharacterized protein n=1 Tax=Culicoidibacter larvae TaxID=2579976 RepID=A0A5R8Q946_9FIRM|nr:hypothetical protein [Culicoidibacter larvae]TLG71359.1 hypothetical protein FEZ08_10720 [Culicoidibacter larvae]
MKNISARKIAVILLALAITFAVVAIAIGQLQLTAENATFIMAVLTPIGAYIGSGAVKDGARAAQETIKAEQANNEKEGK